MRAARKVYAFMYERIPTVIHGKEVLEIATGPGLLAKHAAGAARRMIATDYSDGMIVSVFGFAAQKEKKHPAVMLTGSALGTSSGGNLALGMVPYCNDGHDDTPMPSYIMAISPGTCVDGEEAWQRLSGLYGSVEVGSVEGIGCFRCVKE